MFVTNEEHINHLVVNAFHREMEVYGYQVNIDNYITMLSSLPAGDWPSDLAQWAGANIANLPTEMSDEDVQFVSDYQYRDRLRALLRTERVEQSKARRVLDALKAQIGPDADSKIAAYKASQSAGQ
jgi:hypothetical protein